MKLVFRPLPILSPHLSVWTAFTGGLLFQITYDERPETRATPRGSEVCKYALRIVRGDSARFFGVYDDFRDAMMAAEAEAARLTYLASAHEPMDINSRLAAMADQADSIGRVFANQSAEAQAKNYEGVAQFARLSLLMHAAAQILRAGCDPAQSTKEDDINERTD